MSKLDRAVYDRFMALPQEATTVLAEYVWIGGSGSDLRCKTRTFNKVYTDVAALPLWNFDGSSTGQAPGEDSEVILRPVAIFKDPFRGGQNIIVLCDCLKPDMTPIANNTRVECARAMALVEDQVPWFGLEQEYTLFEADGTTPYGWPKNGFPGPQGPYYCGAGTEAAWGRLIIDAHYKAALYAGCKISGINAEVMPGQWEFQVGPCVGMEAGDHLWMARYLLIRVCEEFGVIVSFDPKPIPGDWNGAGCHTNYSTKAMRADGGMAKIIEAIEKLKLKHKVHIAAYGAGNERRLTGRHETASIEEFSYGVANRGCSVRIPRAAEAENKGYFEDRRPASNMDPYVVTGRIIKTTLLDEE